MKKLFSALMIISMILSVPAPAHAVFYVVNDGDNIPANNDGTGGLQFGGAATVTVDDDTNIGVTDVLGTDTSVDPGANNQGTITLLGTTTFNGTIGTGTNDDLGTLNITDADSSGDDTVTFAAQGFINDMNINADSTIIASNGLTVSNTVVANNGEGTITVTGGTGSFIGIGTSDDHLGTLNINVGATSASFSGSNYIDVLNLSANTTLPGSAAIISTSVVFKEDITVNNPSVGNASITGTITTETNNTGSLTFTDAGTLTGTIGGPEKFLKLILSNNDDGGTLALQGNTYVTTLQIDNGNTTTLADGFNIFATNINGTGAGQGALTYLGDSTTQNNIGGGNALAAVNFTGAGKTINLGHDIAATDTTLSAGTLNIGANTINLTGDYNQTGTSILKLNVTSPTAAGKLVATGNGTVAGTSTIDLNMSAGYIPTGTQYTVIDAGVDENLNAPSVTDNNIFVSGASAVNGTDIIVTLTRDKTYSSVATGGNNAAVGTSLEAAGIGSRTSDMTTVLSNLESSGSTQQVNAALDQLDPDVSGGATQGSTNALGQFLGSVGSHLSTLRSNGVPSGSGISSGDVLQDAAIWALGFGNHFDQDARKGQNGYEGHTFGYAIGMDKLIDRFTLGASFGMAWSAIDSTDTGNTDTNITSYQTSIYGSYDGEKPWYVDAFMAFAHNEYDGDRTINFGAINREADSDYRGQQYSGKVETGYTFNPIQKLDWLKDLEVTPIASLQYSFTQIHDYTETGAGALNLNVDSQGYHAMVQGLGMKYAYPFIWKNLELTPSIHTFWYIDYINDKSQNTASFEGGGTPFTSSGASPARNRFNLGAEVEIFSGNNITISTRYDLDLKDEFQSHSYTGSVRYEF